MSDGTSPVTTTYVLDTATPLTMVLSETTSGVTTRYWHGLDTLAQSDGTSVEYLAYDGLGSVRQLVDETGSVTLAQTFDAYGNGYAKMGSAASSLGFTGEQTDSNGFVFLRARYYQPGMGRFTQMDPSRQERNAYQYSFSNPVMLIDQSRSYPSYPFCGVAYDVPCEPPPGLLIGGQFSGHPQEPPLGIIFEPNVVFHPLRFDPSADDSGPNSQFDIPGFECGSGDNCNLCGPVSVGVIVQNLLENEASPILEEITTAFNSLSLMRGTSWDELHTLFENFEAIAVEPRNADYEDFDLEYPNAGVGVDIETSYKEIYYSGKIRPKLLARKWPIVSVDYTNKGHPIYELSPWAGGYWHWVVVTGLSTPSQWNRGVNRSASLQWVRIFNPFTNGTEYYRAKDFYSYQGHTHGALFAYRNPKVPELRILME